MSALLRGNTTLRTLDMRESAPLSRVGGDALVEALGENYALRDVRVDEEGLADRAAPLLRRNVEFGDVRRAGCELRAAPRLVRAT